MDYLKWNELLARKAFNEEMAGHEVLLFFTEHDIDALAENVGGLSDFIRSLKVGPHWIESADVCANTYKTFKKWRDRELQFPPYIAYLALFVIAASKEGDFNRREYYPRLEELIGEKIVYNHCAKLDELWQDLDRWSKQDKNEQLGRFEARIRGKKRHIGYPYSQTVLSDNERKQLIQVFYEGKLDPADPPADDVLKRILLKLGAKYLEPRTIRLLKGGKVEDEQLLDALLGIVLNELSVWDRISTANQAPEISGDRPPAWLHLCFGEELDRIVPWLRLKTNAEIPEEGLVLEYAGQKFRCDGLMHRWSAPLCELGEETEEFFDASSLDWAVDTLFVDRTHNWTAKFRGTSIKLFLNGNTEGLSGWIESQKLEYLSKFRVACEESRALTVESWGNRCCSEFKKLQVSGLPPKWVLFEGARAFESSEDFDVLVLPRTVRLRLEGGITVDPWGASEFLSCFPPLVLVEGGDGTERVLLEGSELQRRSPETPIWSIPINAPTNKQLELQLYQEDTLITRRFITLTEPVLNPSFQEVKRDRCGDLLTTFESGASTTYASGAQVKWSDISKEEYTACNLPLHLSERIVLLGPSPGEVIDWPREPLPIAWSPVWAVAKRGRKVWFVRYCGSSDFKELPTPNNQTCTRNAVKRWKTAIFTNRKRNRPPRLVKAAVLWKTYVEAAKNVR